MNKKKTLVQQSDLFGISNTMTLEEYKEMVAQKGKPKKKKPVLHEKKFQKTITDTLDQLKLVWVHVKNKCLNRFYHTCSSCGKKDLITCHATINKELTGYPDVMILIGGLELKHRSYGIKTAKLRDGKQKEVCEKLAKMITIKCVNEESQDEIISFLKEMHFKVYGEKGLL